MWVNVWVHDKKEGHRRTGWRREGEKGTRPIVSRTRVCVSLAREFDRLSRSMWGRLFKLTDHMTHFGLCSLLSHLHSSRTTTDLGGDWKWNDHLIFRGDSRWVQRKTGWVTEWDTMRLLTNHPSRTLKPLICNLVDLTCITSKIRTKARLIISLHQWALECSDIRWGKNCFNVCLNAWF